MFAPSHQVSRSLALIGWWTRTNKRTLLYTLGSQNIDRLCLYFSNKYRTQTQNDKFTNKAGSGVEHIPQNNEISYLETSCYSGGYERKLPFEALYNWLDPHHRCINMAYTDFDMPSFRSFDASIIVELSNCLIFLWKHFIPLITNWQFIRKKKVNYSNTQHRSRQKEDNLNLYLKTVSHPWQDTTLHWSIFL